MFLSTDKLDEMHSGIAPYRDASESWGVSRGGWGWDARFVDFDNDGTLELTQATGYLKGDIDRWPELHELALGNDELVRYPFLIPELRQGAEASGHEHNPFYVLGADGRYYDIAPSLANMSDPLLSRGLAVADVDLDGRVDSVTANQWERSFYFHNEAPHPGAFLGLDLRLALGAGPEVTQVRRRADVSDMATIPAFGAQATLRRGDTLQVAEVDGGSGHTGKRAPELHFGLGNLADNKEVAVQIHWRGRDGRVRRETLSLKSGWHTIILGTRNSDLRENH